MIKVLSGWAFPSGGFNQIDGLPLIRIRDLGRETTEVKFKGHYDDTYVVQDGDVLIGMDGDFTVKKWSGGLALLNQRVCKVQSVTQELDQGFLYWYLMPHVAEIHRKTPQTTVRHLSAASLYKIVTPPIPACEQRVVSLILDTLDSTIRQTEAIIKKLKLVKQGLLHDLLTCGIDANGELRPPQSQAPHLYNDSPLGWLPKEWEEVRLEEILSHIDAGKSPSCQDTPAYGDFWGVLKVGAVHPDGLRHVENKIVEDRHLWNAEYLVRRGDLLFSRANTPDLVGLVCLVEDSPRRLMLSDKTLRLTLRPERMLAKFGSMVLQTPNSRAQIEVAATGTSGSMKNISQPAIKSLLVPRPPVDEQLRIILRVAAMDGRCADEGLLLDKLKRLKQGLMDDLLTGRVRVTPLLETLGA